MGRSRKDMNKEIRKENLREYMSQLRNVKSIVDNIEEMERPETDKERISALDKANVSRFRLLNKYMGDQKSVDIHADIEGSIEHSVAAFVLSPEKADEEG